MRTRSPLRSGWSAGGRTPWRKPSRSRSAPRGATDRTEAGRVWRTRRRSRERAGARDRRRSDRTGASPPDRRSRRCRRRRPGGSPPPPRCRGCPARRRDHRRRRCAARPSRGRARVRHCPRRELSFARALYRVIGYQLSVIRYRYLPATAARRSRSARAGALLPGLPAGRMLPGCGDRNQGDLESIEPAEKADDCLQSLVRPDRQAETASLERRDAALADGPSLEGDVAPLPGAPAVVHDADAAERRPVARDAVVLLDRECEIVPGDWPGRAGGRKPDTEQEFHVPSSAEGPGETDPAGGRTVKV